MNEPQYLTTEKFESTMLMTNARFESAMAMTNARFESVMAASDIRFKSAMSAIDSRFDDLISSMNSRFDRNEEVIQSLVSGQQSLLEETRDVKRRVIGLENSVDDIQYSVSTLSRAEEKDAEATINHENRIKRLEKLNNIEGNSPSHLIDIY